MKKINRAILVIILLCLSLISFNGCNSPSEDFTSDSSHVFKFNTPFNFEALSIEEQLEWAKGNGYLIISSIGDKVELENAELLGSFLKNKTEKQELLIMHCHKTTEGIRNAIRGLYFDGKYYHTMPGIYVTQKEWTAIAKYKICGIEEYKGKNYLYVSNDKKFSLEDSVEQKPQYQHDTSYEKYFIIAQID
jgi:hypothetical protein